MNYDPITGRPCHIMSSQQDPTLRQSAVGNIFIKNLDKNIDNEGLYDTFRLFGNILSCNVSTDEKGTSLGYGFVHYETEEAAQEAIAKVNGMLLNDKKLFVGEFTSKKEHLEKHVDEASKFKNVFIKNFGDVLDEESLAEMFKKHGNITSCVVMRDEYGNSNGFGFVNYETHEAAEMAVCLFDGMEIEGRKVTVCRAEKRSERDEKRAEGGVQKMERITRYQSLPGVNLYIKNLEDDIDDERLHLEFSIYGTITSAKVMKDDRGNSKHFGFVCFSSPDEATKAVTEMNGRILVTRPLYVTLAQPKEERRSQLSTQFMQRVGPQRYTSGIPAQFQQGGYSFQPGGQPGFYVPTIPQGQRAFITQPVNQMTRPRWQSSNIRPMASAGYQQVGQIRAGRPPRVPNTMTRHEAPYQLAMAGTYAMSQNIPMSRNIPNQVMRPVLPTPQPQRAAYTFTSNTRNQYPVYVVAQQQQPEQAAVVMQGQEPLTASLLSTASQSEQKQMIGDRLFPLVQEHQPRHAGKITGMLLGIDNSELLNMLESSDLLSAKVDEAVQVIQAHQAKEAATTASVLIDKK